MPPAFLVGLGGGLVVVVQMFAILYAVDHLHAPIAYATMTVLPLTIVTLRGWFFFREGWKRAKSKGMLAACIALLRINI